MIRILHSVSYMSRGGIETMLMNYYRHVDRDKVQFDFLCNSYKKGDYEDEIISMGGRIFRTPGFNPLKYREYRKFMADLFASHPEYKIVEAHNGPFGRHALKAAKDAGVPVRIYHAHGAGLPFNMKWPFKYYCMKTLKHYMNRHFICSEKAGRFYLGQTIMDNGDYQFIPNAIDPEIFKYNKSVRDGLRAEYNLEDKIVIGHIGRLSLPKNHKFLLKLFAEYSQNEPKAVLVLVGDGELRKEIQKSITELRLTDKVILTGIVANPQIWYQAFDIMVMPSLWEGLPVTGIEAQASDLPCIFSSEITKEVQLGEKVSFIGLNEQISKWVDGITELLKYKDSRTDCTELISEKHYNINIEAQRLQDLYLDFAEELNQ